MERCKQKNLTLIELMFINKAFQIIYQRQVIVIGMLVIHLNERILRERYFFFHCKYFILLQMKMIFIALYLKVRCF